MTAPTDDHRTGPVPTPGAIRVVLGGQHVLYRDALAAVVGAAADMRVVGIAADGHEALELIRRENPDVALLEVRLPVLSGPDVAQRVGAAGLRSRILLVSTHRDDGDAYDALHDGGFGYLTTDATVSEIQSAIRAVAGGERVMAAGTTAPAPPVGSVDVVELSWAERRLLRLLADGLPLPVLSRRLNRDLGAVEAEVRELYAKLGVADRRGAIACALRLGLLG